jgi:hypothetical protein
MDSEGSTVGIWKRSCRPGHRLELAAKNPSCRRTTTIRATTAPATHRTLVLTRRRDASTSSATAVTHATTAITIAAAARPTTMAMTTKDAIAEIAPKCDAQAADDCDLRAFLQTLAELRLSR